MRASINCGATFGLHSALISFAIWNISSKKYSVLERWGLRVLHCLWTLNSVMGSSSCKGLQSIQGLISYEILKSISLCGLVLQKCALCAVIKKNYEPLQICRPLLKVVFFKVKLKSWSIEQSKSSVISFVINKRSFLLYSRNGNARLEHSEVIQHLSSFSAYRSSHTCSPGLCFTASCTAKRATTAGSYGQLPYAKRKWLQRNAFWAFELQNRDQICLTKQSNVFFEKADFTKTFKTK